MVDTIKSVPPAANGSRIAGYKKLVKQLEGLAVPHPSEKTVRTVDAWFAKAKLAARTTFDNVNQNLDHVAATLEVEADRREAAPQSPFDKITSPLDKLISWI
jgi:hypothetical protein